MTDATPQESYAARMRREAQDELQRIAEARTELDAEMESLRGRMEMLELEAEAPNRIIMALDASLARARERDTAERESEDRPTRVFPAPMRDRVVEIIEDGQPFTIESMRQRLAGEGPTLPDIGEVEGVIDFLLGIGTVMDVSLAFEGSEDGLKTYIKAGVDPSADMPGIRTSVALDDEEPPADEDARGDDGALADEPPEATNGSRQLRPQEIERQRKVGVILAHVREHRTVTVNEAAGLLGLTPQGARLIVLALVRDGALRDLPRESAREPVQYEVTEQASDPEYVPSVPPGNRGQAASDDGEPGAVVERKSPAQLSFEQVRDWVQANCRQGRFGASSVAEALGCARNSVVKYLNMMADKGTIVKHGTTGRFVEYEFIKARDAAIPSPTHAPRSQGPHGPRPMRPPARNGSREAVPYTGKPKGRTGKPGRDKKLAAAGFRVKDKKR